MAKVEVLQHDALDRRILQQAMTRCASVVRDSEGLRDLAVELEAAPARPIRNRADFEDVALTATARVVAAAALARTESRGCHHRSDYPDTDPAQAVSRTLHDRPTAVAGLT
jgi:L-aspartate oxidase